VNTLVPRTGGGWWGTNTDVEGFSAPLREALAAGESWRGRSALVLGCGGSARAVVAGLVELGLERIRIAGRRPQALAEVLADCRDWAPALQTLPWPERPGALAQELAAADLVVHTTPVGMAAPGDPGAAGRCPLAEADLEGLGAGCVVYDLIYTPRPSELLRRASARGCRVLDGLEMLVRQGAASLRLWSSLEAVPVEAMRAAALAQLDSA
jgi:shikimate dehydrogenase